MKKLLLSFLLLSFHSICADAQAMFTTLDSVDINKIHANIMVHGDMWWNPFRQETGTNPETDMYGCNIYGSIKNIGFAGALWMGAYDAGNSLHVAAQSYRDGACDYWPGPIDATGAISYTASKDWAKIWKVNGSDVQYFNSQSSHTTSNTPASILTWPGKGNVHARGNGGTVLSVNTDMAPFVDLNSNGIYEPLQGEYPDFRGEQALWYIFNDNGPTHSQTQAKPLGVEVHALIYAYKRGTLIDNVVYYDYTLVNRSANSYHDMRFGLWNDVDLGWGFDDFLGFDSSRRLGICYNGSNDDGATYGHPINSFGFNPPVSGVTLVSLPGDNAASYIPAGAFTYYNNDGPMDRAPYSDTNCYNFMKGVMISGMADTIASFHNYVFTGDLADPTSWAECNMANTAADRRYILSSNDFTFNAGGIQHIVMAQVVTDTGDGGCPHASFTGIKEVSDTAWSAYYNPPTSLHRHTPSNNTGTTNEVHAYPNPAHDKLYIDGKDDAAITLYNAMGQAVHVPVRWNGQKYDVDISMLPRGLYNALYRNGSVKGNMKFMKE